MSTNIAPIAEGITAGQIGRASDRFSDRCRTNSASLPKDAVQQILEEEGDQLAQDMFEALRVRVERRLKMIIRKVTVNRARTPQEALSATRRKQYVSEDVVAIMPKGDGDKAEVVFFKPEPWEYTKPGWMSDDDLEKVFDRRSLKSADPISVAAANEADEAFADEHPNATHWKDSGGEWCFAAFSLWSGDRDVLVSRGGHGWDGHWWFAGVRK